MQYVRFVFPVLLALAFSGSVVAQVPASGQENNSRDRKLAEPIENSIGMKLAYCPAGEYLRGAPESDKEALEDERPQHKVRITKGFHFGTTEVTQEQWKAVMKTEPWKGEKYAREGAGHPASYLSWEDAQEFCKKLSAKEGKNYRLPTEAEWEYACRAGSKTTYSFGNSPDELGGGAWYAKNANDIGEKYAHQVAQKKANAWGLYDMHGNVWEWCQDWYDRKQYNQFSGGVAVDPQGATSGSSHVLRGGSWDSSLPYCRSANRSVGGLPSDRYYVNGFRVVLSQ